MSLSPELAIILAASVCILYAVGLFIAIITIRRHQSLFLKEKARYEALYVQYMDLLSKHIANAGRGKSIH